MVNALRGGEVNHFAPIHYGPKKEAVEGKRFVDELINSGKFGQEDAQRMLSSLNRSGQIYEVKPGFYRKL